MKRNGTIKGFLLGAVTMVLLVSLIGTALATTGNQKLTVLFNDIKLIVDGKPVTPKDALGNVVEPFVYNGTTYLPVRAVGDAIGKSVYWEGKTKTVYLGVVDGQTPVENLTNLPVFQGDTLKMDPSGYTDNTGALRQPAVGNYLTSSTYLLNMKYSQLKGNIALADGSKNSTDKLYLNIYGDDKIIYTSTVITAGSYPQDFNVDVSGVVKLKIAVTTNDYGAYTILSGLDLYN